MGTQEEIEKIERELDISGTPASPKPMPSPSSRFRVVGDVRAMESPKQNAGMSSSQNNQYQIKIEDYSEDGDSDSDIDEKMPTKYSDRLRIEDESFDGSKTAAKKEKKDKKGKKDKKKKTKREKKAKKQGEDPSSSSRLISRPNKPPAVVGKEIFIVNPMTNEECSLDDAVRLGLIDEDTAEQYRRENQ